MTLDRLRELHQARPFQRFIVRLADGRSIPVDHPEMMAVAPTGRTVGIFQRDNTFSWVDVMLVTELEVRPGNGRRKKGAARP
ncbi:MAG: hypothetical protein NTW87_30300 [Planctomycetota bacterium]|nr:hypothetical protein [Planctomycetota bacterium]